MRQRSSLFFVLMLLCVIAAVWSFMLINASRSLTLEQRARAIGEQLKCPICQGESVADSPSTLSQQMRGIILQQLREGKSEQEIIQYFRNSYGDQIIWSPPWQGFTLLAWLAPIALLVGGVILLFLTLRDWRAAPALPADIVGEGERGQGESAEDLWYREQLAAELAAEDSLFEKYRMEAE